MSDDDPAAPIRAKLVAEVQADMTLLPKLTVDEADYLLMRIACSNWQGWTEDEARWSAIQQELMQRLRTINAEDPTAAITARRRRAAASDPHTD